MPDHYEIAIAGAGIGGLATALFLKKLGHQVVIYEQFDEPKPVGSGLVLQPTGLSVLNELGLKERIVQYGKPINRLMGISVPSQKTVLDVGYGAKQHPRYGYAIHRSALFTVLFDAVLKTGIKIETSKKIIEAKQTAGNKVQLITDKGHSTPPYHFAINCIGVESPLSPTEGKLLPYGALWANLDWINAKTLKEDRLEQRYQQARKMVGILPIGTTPTEPKPQTAFFWSLKHQDFVRWKQEPIEHWKEEVLALWPEIESFLDQIESHEALTMALYRHKTLAYPVTQNIVHLGDSYHAASPQLGQGANMALLDAMALNRSMQTYNNLDGIFSEYARLRRFHVLIYQTASYLFTPVYQSDNRILPIIRDRLFGQLIKVPPAPQILSSLVAGTLGNPFSTLTLKETFLSEEGRSRLSNYKKSPDESGDLSISNVK